MRPILLGLLTCGFAIHALAADEDAQRLKAASDTLQEIMGTPDKGIPTSLFQKAECVVIIPGMKKAGFVFSGKYGRGYASCRKASGGWTDPAGMRIEGGGFGFQIGGSETDLVLLVMSRKGMNGLLTSKFTLGGEASVAGGPVGRDATAQTDATMRADILSWSRSRGVFAGISLQGGTLRPDEDANKGLYGQKVSSKSVLTGESNPTLASDPLKPELKEYGGSAPLK
jgi:lipid-binding SYLF domain-containing protein